MGVVQGITSPELKANASFTIEVDPNNSSQFMLVSHTQGSLKGYVRDLFLENCIYC